MHDVSELAVYKNIHIVTFLVEAASLIRGYGPSGTGFPIITTKFKLIVLTFKGMSHEKD